MRDEFDISGVFETTEFEIAQVTCIWVHIDLKSWCVLLIFTAYYVCVGLIFTMRTRLKIMCTNPVRTLIYFEMGKSIHHIWVNLNKDSKQLSS